MLPKLYLKLRFEPQIATVQIRVVIPRALTAKVWPQFIKSKMDLLESVTFYLCLAILHVLSSCSTASLRFCWYVFKISV